MTSSEGGDNDGVASNGKMIAAAWKSTATVAVFNADRALGFDARTPLLKGHTGSILDLTWSPFEDRLLATCGDDGKAKMWVFDDYEGLTGGADRAEADLELEAHSRKCMSVQWHSAAENLLATHSNDRTVKVWDINEDRCDDAMITFTDMPDFCTSIRWSPDGKMIGGQCKNKTMVFFDPRQESSVLKAPGHIGPRQ